MQNRPSCLGYMLILFSQPAPGMFVAQHCYVFSAWGLRHYEIEFRFALVFFGTSNTAACQKHNKEKLLKWASSTPWDIWPNESDALRALRALLECSLAIFYKQQWLDISKQRVLQRRKTACFYRKSWIPETVPEVLVLRTKSTFWLQKICYSPIFRLVFNSNADHFFH